MNVLLQPEAHSVGARRVDGGEVGVFEAREEAELAPLPIQRKRALHDEEVAEDGFAFSLSSRAGGRGRSYHFGLQ